MEAEGKKLELEKGFLGVCQNREKKIQALNMDLQTGFSGRRMDRVKYEGQIKELVSGNKRLTRRVEGLESELVSLKKVKRLGDMQIAKLRLENDEMRKIYR